MDEQKDYHIENNYLIIQKTILTVIKKQNIMKNIINKTSSKIIGILLLISIVGFTISQSPLVQEKKRLIIGTWIVGDEITNKWIFTSNNECKWELDGKIIGKFTYIIDSEFSDSGLEHPFIKLTTVNSNFFEVGEETEYAINGLGERKMILEYNTGIGISYTHFTKQ